MKILLGSASEDKLTILHSAVPDAEVIPFTVASDVSDQPLSRDETARGALRRAENAIRAYRKGDFDYAVGMEGGLENINNVFNLICYAAVISKSGKVRIRSSDPLALPREVSDAVRRGEPFGKVIREYAEENDSDEVRELITRKKSFIFALKSALVSFSNDL